jgi:chromosome partitioning protein
MRVMLAKPHHLQRNLFTMPPIPKSDLDRLLERFKTIVNGGDVKCPDAKFSRYAVTNFRGGIGKSTLAFNLAWELSRRSSSLLVDTCPQCNFTQSLVGDDIEGLGTTIYDALLPKVMPGIPEVKVDDLIVSVPPHCTSFKGGQAVYVVPGSKELFLFPSLLYTQLSSAAGLGSRSKETSKNILRSIESLIDAIQRQLKLKKTLIDTSPFFGGATHLAWVAAEALIIPVRVDQHSMEALKLTLSMLTDKKMDYLRLNEQAGIKHTPKVHAIAMTHCGWNRQTTSTPDRSTQAYLSNVLEIVKQHADLFSSEDPVECIHLLDDFHSAGRISGTKRIPLAKLSVGESHTIEGQRLEVNVSISRYKNELKSLASSL